MEHSREQEKKPRPAGKKKHWIWLLALTAAVGVGSVLHYLDIPHISVKRGNGNLVITIGAEQKHPSHPNVPTQFQRDETMTLEKFSREVTPSMVTVVDGQKATDFGIIVSRNGYIITCARTGTEESERLVRLSDGKEYPARTVGQDENGRMLLLKIDATELTPVRFSGDLRQSSPAVEVMGLTVDEIPHRARIFFSLPHGVHVQAVEEDSAAMRCGLRPGDMITALDDIAICNPQEFSLGGKTEVKLTVFRDGDYREINLKLQ